MPYPTTDELTDASSVAQLTELPPEQRDRLRAVAIAAVEGFCGQSFDLEEDTTVTVDGTGYKAIYLPRRLVGISELAVSGSSLDAGDVTLGADNGRLHITPGALPGDYYSRALRDDVPAGFTLGPGTVEITGDWGWEEPPEAVVTAIRLDMEEQALAAAHPLAGTVRGMGRLGVTSLSEGPLSAELAQGRVGTLSAEVQQLLIPYVWPTSGFSI